MEGKEKATRCDDVLEVEKLFIPKGYDNIPMNDIAICWFSLKSFFIFFG